MIKKVSAIALCVCLFTVTALAATYGTVSDVRMGSGSQPTGGPSGYDSTDQNYRNGTGAYLGGRNTRSLNRSGNKEMLGFGKENNFKQAINKIFGYDLADYGYISFGELWEEKDLNDTLKSVRSIAADIFVKCNEGDHLPLGFLYNDNTVYTIVEKKNGEVVLTEYQIPSLNNHARNFSVEKNNSDSEQYSNYSIVNEVSKSVEKNSLSDLYQKP